jgi:hypothetical protein
MATYVVLHGAISNAGDFLVKHRALSLLRHYRPEVELIEMERWEPLDEKVDIVNEASAVILCGGPAVKRDVFPGIYPLVRDLSTIKPPIVTMGVGWHAPYGEWSDTWNHGFTARSELLLQRIQNSGLVSSCRDYHTLNALNHQGFSHFAMTGCPAWYDIATLNNGPKMTFKDVPIHKVAFSFGVNMYRDGGYMRQTMALISALSGRFGDKLSCVFHHPIGKHRNSDVVRWLEQESIRYVDIAGGSDLMMEHYADVDLHVGYRVHAHILMSSLNRRSVLIAEDGRSVGQKTAMGGAVVVPFRRKGLRLRRFPGGRRLGYVLGISDITDDSTIDVLALLDHEVDTGFPKSVAGHLSIRAHSPVMEQFVGQLP